MRGSQRLPLSGTDSVSVLLPIHAILVSTDISSIAHPCRIVKRKFTGFFWRDVCFAYSGDVFSITIEGEMVFVLAYSGGDGAVFPLIWIFFRLTAG